MTSWILSQVVIIAYAIASALHHAPAVTAFREYVPTPNPYERPFHRWAGAQATVVAVSISLGLLSYQSLVWCIVSGVLSFLWYWLLFDIVLNKSTGKSWDYLGGGSELDRMLKRNFGSNAGQIKAVCIVVVIILLNATKIIL